MPQDVGVQGIVLLEGENILYMISHQNYVKKVVKKGRIFEVVGVCKGKRILLNGNTLCEVKSYQIPKSRLEVLNHNPFKYFCLLI